VELRRRTHDHGVHLVDGLGSGLDGRTASQAQHAQLLHPVIASLGHHSRGAGEHGAGGGLGIDGVGLAPVPVQLAVGTPDLCHRDAFGSQQASQAGPVRTRPLHTVSHLRSQAQSPFVQGAAAPLGGGDLALPEQSPVVVDGNGHVDVLVSVDAHDDLFLCQAGLGHRFPPRTMASHRWDGWTRLSGDLWSGSYQVTFVPSVPRGDSGEGRQISMKAHVASGRRGQTLPGTA
jgi:hypothetical protein